jgi:hypothetical protein
MSTTSRRRFPPYREAATGPGASISCFHGDVYTLTESRKTLCRPPQHPAGASASTAGA